MEPDYERFVDRLLVDDVLLTPTWRLLLPYLNHHPQRVADLRALLPRAFNGLEAHWCLQGDQLILERLMLPGGYDAVEEMLLWRALFPGLRRPLPAWWINGVWRFHEWDAQTNEKLDYREVLCFEQGRLDNPKQVISQEPEDALREFPLLLRLAVLPILFVALPFFLFKNVSHPWSRSTWKENLFHVGLMVLIWFLLPVMVLFPDMLKSRWMEVVRRHVEALRGTLNTERAVDELLQEKRCRRS